METTVYGADGRLVCGVRVVIRENGRFEMDAHGQPVQYAVQREGDGLFLRTIERDDWVSEPVIMEVQSIAGRARI